MNAVARETQESVKTSSQRRRRTTVEARQSCPIDIFSPASAFRIQFLALSRVRVPLLYQPVALIKRKLEGGRRERFVSADARVTRCRVGVYINEVAPMRRRRM